MKSLSLSTCHVCPPEFVSKEARWLSFSYVYNMLEMTLAYLPMSKYACRKKQKMKKIQEEDILRERIGEKRGRLVVKIKFAIEKE